MRHPASIMPYGADHRNTPLAAFGDYGVLFAVAYLTVLCLALIPLAVSVVRQRERRIPRALQAPQLARAPRERLIPRALLPAPRERLIPLVLLEPRALAPQARQIPPAPPQVRQRERRIPRALRELQARPPGAIPLPQRVIPLPQRATVGIRRKLPSATMARRRLWLTCPQRRPT
jgi:hypothetical protein